ncbi:acetylglutamate kinase [Flagellimonas zhangzhouensis]|uniref:Acetylglutamate kinase n=1 Tax=Flagellimonas zhangzhouensis TaxID=1073328 RepID=A0A1H2VKQ2_9FLAO|nr:acetylglutamate kinase [Allomuricauda zhangzhouensis]SDQ07190.1 N-acetylglutamate kinase [Allomuricauda zhangzhouensis]SDW68903.1 N-acetylglutamate kinase [Allomuricauda zhangzhouensis]
MKQKLSIVKIGGNVIEDAEGFEHVLGLFSKMEGNKILVHGGGRKATELGNKLGIESKMVNGRRITDADTLDIALMVYGGLVSKKIVAKLQALGTDAIGMSGADGDAIRAHKRPKKNVDFGLVGDVDTVNTYAIFKLLQAGFTPIFCALTHDGKGQMLNTNADTIAAEIAIAMSDQFETTLYYCFEKKGVLQDVNDENSVIRHIDSKGYDELLAYGIIADGMLPKMHNCFYALRNHVAKVCVGNSSMLEANNPDFTTLTL